MGIDLSLKDIKFLRAIRDINNDPEAYPETDRGEVPANKVSIRKATGLGSDVIEYRLGGSNRRGFDQDNLGLIKVHSATIEGNTFGPKSAELTSKGLEELSKVEDEGVLEDGESTENEAIKQLRARLDEIENTEFSEEGEVSAGELASMVEQVRTQIDELESKIETRYERLEGRIDDVENGQTTGEWGNVSEEKTEDLDRVLRMAPAIAFAWVEVLGVDLHEIVDEDSVSEDMIQSYRRTAAQSLQGAMTDGDGEGSGFDPGETVSDDVAVESPGQNATGSEGQDGQGGDAGGDGTSESPSQPVVDEPGTEPNANTDGGEITQPEMTHAEEESPEQATLDDDDSADVIGDGGEVTDADVDADVSKPDDVETE